MHQNIEIWGRGIIQGVGTILKARQKKASDKCLLHYNLT